MKKDLNKPELVLSILIATTVDRRDVFYPLLDEFERQVKEHKLEDKVEICYMEDNKELTIGSKRNNLINMSRGEWIVFFDSDDMPIDYYVPLIVQKLEEHRPDCIGFKIKMTTNGEKPQICDHSLRHAAEGWQTNKKGFDYIRNVTHFNPVRRSYAIRVGFPEVRYGEDKVYSDKITKLCKTEYYLDIPYLFEYRYSNAVEHNKKYGIK
jgi:glycosyltransferase involved in cell wall biosynthesis